MWVPCLAELLRPSVLKGRRQSTGDGITEGTEGPVVVRPHLTLRNAGFAPGT